MYLQHPPLSSFQCILLSLTTAGNLPAPATGPNPNLLGAPTEVLTPRRSTASPFPESPKAFTLTLTLTPGLNGQHFREI